MHEQKAYSHSFPPDNNLDTWTPIILFTTEKNPYTKWSSAMQITQKSFVFACTQESMYCIADMSAQQAN